MIFDQIEFHNVEELEQTKKGYLPRRLPSYISNQMNPGVRDSKLTTGIELRFKMLEDSVDLILTCDESLEAAVAHIYYGSIQAGWENSARMIYTHETKLHIERPKEMKKLQEITKEYNLPFEPEIVRVVLPYVTCYYVGIEGKVEPPSVRKNKSNSEVPEKTYLAYGSSITHGSLGLAMPYSYPFRIAQKLHCDYINLGFAGAAFMEKEMAEYIVSRKDWDFASVEMGINLLAGNEILPLKEFEKRIDEFTSILSKDPRTIFATSLFGFSGERQERGQEMREIIKHYAKERLIFTDGLELLDNKAYIAADLVHPSIEGMAQIGDRWGEIMRAYLSKNENE